MGIEAKEAEIAAEIADMNLTELETAKATAGADTASATVVQTKIEAKEAEIAAEIADMNLSGTGNLRIIVGESNCSNQSLEHVAQARGYSRFFSEVYSEIAPSREVSGLSILTPRSGESTNL